MPDLPLGDISSRRTCTPDDGCPDLPGCRMSLTERSRVMGLLGAEAVEVRHVEQNLAAFEGVTVTETFTGAEVYRLAHRDSGATGSAPCGVASIYLTARVSLADVTPCPKCWPVDRRLLGWLHGNTRPTTM